jgi:hypothetical protein
MFSAPVIDTQQQFWFVPNAPNTISNDAGEHKRSACNSEDCWINPGISLASDSRFRD